MQPARAYRSGAGAPTIAEEVDVMRRYLVVANRTLGGGHLAGS